MGWGRQRWVGPLVCAGLALAGCSSAVDRAGGGDDPQPTVLRMVNPLNNLEVQPFVDTVARVSHGSLRIDLQSDWHLGDLAAESDLVGYVRRGGAPLGVTPVRAWHTAGISSFDALIAPFAVDSMALEKRVLQSNVVDDMLHGMADPGLTGLGILPGPIRRPVGVTHQLVTASERPPFKTEPNGRSGGEQREHEIEGVAVHDEEPQPREAHDSHRDREVLRLQPPLTSSARHRDTVPRRS